MATQDGGPAFPMPGYEGPHSKSGSIVQDPVHGMSQREFGEWMALQGLLTNPSMISPGQLKASRHHENLVKVAREIATAMLKAREGE